MGQQVVFVEMVSPDHERAQRFYRQPGGRRAAMGGDGPWTPEPASTSVGVSAR